MPENLPRRRFVATAAYGAVVPAWLRADEPKPKYEPVAFFLVGATHYVADKEDTAKLDDRSKLVTGRLVDLLNKLPGADIPRAAGGGTVLAPRGVIHAGDCIDTGDKANVKLRETEWAAVAEGGRAGVQRVQQQPLRRRAAGVLLLRGAGRRGRRARVPNVGRPGNGLRAPQTWTAPIPGPKK